jgi:hypothetical protein
MSVLSQSDQFENKSTASIDVVPARVWAGGIAIIALVSIALRYTSLNHNDNAWLLYAVGEYIAGSKFYVDLVEINPPLVFLLYYPPVWLANLLSIEINIIFYTYVSLLAAASCCLSYVLLDKVGSINRLIVVLLIVVALFIIPRGDFGQREHFMVIFSLPYIFLIMRRIEDKFCTGLFASVIGLLAVLGFGLKPYFLLIPVFLEGLLLFKSRSVKKMFRPETIMLAIGLSGYIAAIFYVTPEYFTKIVPIALEVYNQAFNAPFFRVVFRTELILIILLTGTGGLILREGNPLPSAMTALLIAGSAAYIMYVVQMKGWSYQSYPALAFLSISAGVLVAEWSRQTGTRATRLAIIFISSIVLLTLPILSLVDYRYKSIRTQTWKKIVAENQPVTDFLILSSTLSAGFPLATVEGLTWASRFPTLWMLPGIIQKRAAAAGKPLPKIDAIERYHTDAVVEDLIKFKPQLVFVDVRPEKPQYGGIPFDFVDYFSKDARFKKLWSQYEKIGLGRLGFEYYRLKK